MSPPPPTAGTGITVADGPVGTGARENGDKAGGIDKGAADVLISNPAGANGAAAADTVPRYGGMTPGSTRAGDGGVDE